MNFIRNFVKENPYLLASDMESIEPTPPLGKEGPLDFLCVFEEKRQLVPHHFTSHHHHQARAGHKQSKSTWQRNSPITCTLCNKPKHLINKCRELSRFNHIFHLVFQIPYKNLSNQEKFMWCYCRICSQFHHTRNCQYLTRFCAAGETLKQTHANRPRHNKTLPQRWIPP